jgi:TonB family protein
VRKIALFIAIALISWIQVPAQSAATPAASSPGAERKVLTRISPNYPDLARKMRIQGVVKVEVIVRPNGTVKSMRVLGGSPVLVEAAADAVKRWKFQAAQSETAEVVQVAFENN